jgi:hypothetical protein
LGDDAGVWPDGAVCVHLLGTVRFVVVETSHALHTGPGLGTHTDTLAGLDLGDLASNSQGFPDDL